MRELNYYQIERLSEFEETFHPMKFYCRMRDVGIEKKEAKIMAEIYEIGIYNKIIDLIHEE